MSFSEPGRDDGSLPPVNVVIPDDARDLDRDVLAYRRELRARRWRQRISRLSGPLRSPGFGGRATIIPLVAACLAISLVGGALLSVMTTSPAAAPTLTGPQASAQPAVSAQDLTELPAGTLQVSGRAVQVRSLAPAAIALVPAGCGCGAALSRLAAQATAARVSLYFSGSGAAIGQLGSLTARYGDGVAIAAADPHGVLAAAYQPSGLTVLLAFSDATAKVARNLTGEFQLTAALRELKLAGASPGNG